MKDTQRGGKNIHFASRNTQKMHQKRAFEQQTQKIPGKVTKLCWYHYCRFFFGNKNKSGTILDRRSKQILED